MNGSSDILSNLALHHNSQFRCRQPVAFQFHFQVNQSVKHNLRLLHTIIGPMISLHSWLPSTEGAAQLCNESCFP